jgi:outer membrane receptor protein involved in Fe transport
MKHKSILVTSVALAVAGSPWAAAAAAAADQGTDLEEVVITATKRESTVQDTPISVTAISAADIANKGLTDFNSLAQTVPGIAMRTSGPGQTEFEMRGLNSAGGNASVVGFYLDETALSSPASAQLGKIVIDPNLYDLNRVEILRGPQGTLYGSSSMAGTVKVVPNAPQLGVYAVSGETVVSQTGSGGGTNFTQNGMVNLPLGTEVALRLVGSSDSESGWLNRYVFADGAVPTDGATGARPPGFYTAPLAEIASQANASSLDSFRASLLWRPVDELSITPAFMWQHTHQDGPNAVDVNGAPSYPQVPAAQGHWEIYDTPEPQDDRFTLGSLKIEWQTEHMLITSATGDWTRRTLVSQDGTEENDGPSGLGSLGTASPYDTAAGGAGPTGPGPSGPGVQERDATQQFSEELRLTSTDKGPFQWQAGYYFQRLKSEWDMWSVNPQLLSAGVGNVYVDYMPQTITQNALFGEGSLEFAPGWKATLGLRGYHYQYTQNNSEWGDFTPYGFTNLLSGAPTLAGNTAPFNTTASGNASGVNPKFDLSWQMNPQLLLYATAARGFRMGGTDQPFTGYATTVSAAACGAPSSLAIILQCGLQQKLSATRTLPGGYYAPNVQFPNASAQGVPQFKSDSVWNYELGEKGEFFDRQLTLNVDVYYERWNNPQLATNVGGFGYTVNGSNASILGSELEMWLKLPAGFSFAGNLGLADSKFLSDNAVTGYLSGTAIPDSPKVTSSVTLRNVQPLTGQYQLISSLSYNYIGERTNAPYGETITLFNMNQLLVHLPAYGLMNLRAGVKADDWSFNLFANNLLNKETLLDTQPQINLQSAAFTRYIVNQPRTFGLDVNYSFGR